MVGNKNIIQRAILGMVNWARGDQGSDYIEYDPPTIKRSRHPHSHGTFEETNQGMNFTVYNATGGQVVQVFSYDPARDRSTSSLYIIHEGDNLGEELGVIVTREKLTR